MADETTDETELPGALQALMLLLRETAVEDEALLVYDAERPHVVFWLHDEQYMATAENTSLHIVNMNGLLDENEGALTVEVCDPKEWLGLVTRFETGTLPRG